MAMARSKKALCADFGFEGVFPLDSALDLDGLDGPTAGARIARANEDLMRGCDLLIANMTPFRGPGMDGGTAYEMGFMRALGRPVLGYSTKAASFADRTHAFVGRAARRRDDGGLEDADGLLIEDFGLSDNLMMATAVAASGGQVAVGEVAATDLDGFVRCLEQARTLLRPKG